MRLISVIYATRHVSPVQSVQLMLCW